MHSILVNWSKEHKILWQNFKFTTVHRPVLLKLRSIADKKTQNEYLKFINVLALLQNLQLKKKARKMALRIKLNEHTPMQIEWIYLVGFCFEIAPNIEDFYQHYNFGIFHNLNICSEFHQSMLRIVFIELNSILWIKLFEEAAKSNFYHHQNHNESWHCNVYTWNWYEIY